MADDFAVLRKAYDTAVAAADPKKLIPQYLAKLVPTRPTGNVVILGAGKAAAAMAQAAEQYFIEKWCIIPRGVVVTQEGAASTCQHIEVMYGDHPVPSQRSVKAAQAIVDEANSCCQDDLVVMLISGGGSSLMTLPKVGITLAMKQQLNQDLLNCGATIQEMNVVRKQLSDVKGGRLAEAIYPAKLLSLAISDVPGDDPAMIASGPTLPDISPVGEAGRILEKYKIKAPKVIEEYLTDGADSRPLADDPCLASAQFDIIAKASDSLSSAATYLSSLGFKTIVLGDDLQGDAEELGHQMAVRALELQRTATQPIALLSGGETSVAIGKSGGKGGRNTTFLLSLMNSLNDASNISALACDTDGIDGKGDHAGAYYISGDVAAAERSGNTSIDFLSANNSYAYFEALNRLIITGPTETNVNDFRLILILPNIH